MGQSLDVSCKECASPRKSPYAEEPDPVEPVESTLVWLFKPDSPRTAAQANAIPDNNRALRPLEATEETEPEETACCEGCQEGVADLQTKTKNSLKGCAGTCLLGVANCLDRVEICLESKLRPVEEKQSGESSLPVCCQEAHAHTVRLSNSCYGGCLECVGYCLERIAHFLEEKLDVELPPQLSRLTSPQTTLPSSRGPEKAGVDEEQQGEANPIVEDPAQGILKSGQRIRERQVSESDFPSQSNGVLIQSTGNLPSQSKDVTTKGLESTSMVLSGSKGVQPMPDVLSQPKGVEPTSDAPSESKCVIPASDAPSESRGVEPTSDVPSDSKVVDPTSDVPSESKGVEPTSEVPSESKGVEPTSDVPSESKGVEPTSDVLSESKAVEPTPEVPSESKVVEPAFEGRSSV